MPDLLAPLRALPLGSISGPAWLMIVGASLNRMGALLQLFLVLYLTDEGLSAAQAGAVLAAYGAGAVLGVGIGGAAADRIGPRATVVASMLASAADAVLFVVVRDVAALLALAVVGGAAAQLFRPAAAALIASRTAPADLVAVTGVYRLGINVAATVAPLLGGVLFVWEPAGIFVLDAVTSAAFAVVAFVGLRSVDTPAHGEGDRDGRLRDLLADRRYLLVVLGQLLTCAVEIQYLVALPLWLRDTGAAPWVFPTVVALNGALVICLELVVLGLVRDTTLRTRIAVGSGLIGVGLAVFGLGTAPAVVGLAVLVWTFGEMLCAPAVNAYPGLVAPPGLTGRYYGALAVGQTAGWAVGPALGGLGYERLGAGVWVACAVGGVLAYLAMRAGVRPTATGRT